MQKSFLRGIALFGLLYVVPVFCLRKIIIYNAGSEAKVTVKTGNWRCKRPLNDFTVMKNFIYVITTDCENPDCVKEVIVDWGENKKTWFGEQRGKDENCDDFFIKITKGKVTGSLNGFEELNKELDEVAKSRPNMTRDWDFELRALDSEFKELIDKKMLPESDLAELKALVKIGFLNMLPWRGKNPMITYTWYKQGQFVRDKQRVKELASGIVAPYQRDVYLFGKARAKELLGKEKAAK